MRDAATGQPIPCKLTLVGVGNPDPQFTHNDIGRQEGDGAIVAYNRVMAIWGVGVVPVPVGTYDVYVSRGPEWDLFVARKLTVTAAGVTLVAQLRHVIDTRGWLSGDFHVHAAASSDSHVPMHDRVYEFIADGVELIVSTDHNVVSSYQPIIDELGVGTLLASAMGDELTTNGWGHFGAFPLPRDLNAAGHGAVLVRGRTAKDFFGDVRHNAPSAIVDVHHPRIDNEVGYFNVAGFSPHGDFAERPGFSFDFDALEVVNGYQDAERRSIQRVIDDWFALLNHGHLVTATGNSDTHHLDYNIGGYPRNFMRIDDDRPERLTTDDIARAVKGHHLFFTTAPFVRAAIDGAGYGDVATVKTGRARIDIAVDAAPWVSVSSVVLYVNGGEARRWQVAPGTEVARFHEQHEFPVSRDSYVVVRVEGDKPLAPIVGDNRRYDVHPFALTNPIFVDTDGNHRYDPPLPHTAH